MKTEELIRPDWKEFGRRLQERCRGSMVTIELVNPDGARRTIVKNEPLQSVATEESDCNTHFVLETGAAGAKPARHEIIDPSEAVLHQQGSDRCQQLDIFGENGTTIATFHPGLTPDVWQGFEARRKW